MGIIIKETVRKPYPQPGDRNDLQLVRVEEDPRSHNGQLIWHWLIVALEDLALRTYTSGAQASSPPWTSNLWQQVLALNGGEAPQLPIDLDSFNGKSLTSVFGMSEKQRLTRRFLRLESVFAIGSDVELPLRH